MNFAKRDRGEAMYRIALCDDEPNELNKTRAMLDCYRASHPDYPFEVQEFPSMATLLFDIDSPVAFDLLLLDIYMPGQTGMEGAKELRERGFDGSIIFLTTSKEHGIDAFGVEATQYLVKPVEENRFHTVLDKIFKKIAEERRRFIALRTENEIRRVAVRDIVYCETQDHSPCINLSDGELLRSRMKLTELLEMVSEFEDFVPVGSIYIVNLGYVDALTAKEMTLTTGKVIYLPRGSYRALKEQYFKFYRDR